MNEKNVVESGVLEEVCVKCGKPHPLPRDQSIVRCPWCKDFFKPLAELIVLHEEELHRLRLNRPGNWLLSSSFLQWFFRILFIIPWIYGYFWVALGLILGLEAWMIRLRMSGNTKRILDLSRALEELEILYRKEQ